MSVIDLKNWRFNPFTNVTHDATITDELHTIAYQDDWNAYGIQTNEMPLFENPSSLSVRKVSDSSLFTEVSRSQAPQPGEYRVDYDGETFFGTGRIEFNIADNATEVKVTYQGTGSVVKNRNTLGASTFPADIEVDGETTLNDAVLIDSTLNVTGKTTVDNMDATGTVVFTGAPTINAAPSSDTDAVRKSYLDALYNKIFGVVSKTDNFIITTENIRFIDVDTTDHDVTVTLPDLATYYGRVYRTTHSVKGSTNKAILAAGGSDKITKNNLTSIYLSDAGNYIEVFASQKGACWQILDSRIKCQIVLDTYAGYGSTLNNKILRYTNTRENVGNLFVVDDSAANGLNITTSIDGRWSGSMTIGRMSGACDYGISLNSDELTTSIASIAIDHKLCTGRPETTFSDTASFSRWLPAGSVLRPHADGDTGVGSTDVLFSICWMG